MIFLIKIYQYIKPIRTLFFTTIGINPHSCRHSPSCSEYAKNAIKRYGTIQGSILGLIRIIKCNPLIEK